MKNTAKMHSEPLWEYTDGGRQEAGILPFRVYDCSSRAIAVATDTPYRQVWNYMNEHLRRTNRADAFRPRTMLRKGATQPADMGVCDFDWIPVLKHFAPFGILETRHGKWEGRFKKDFRSLYPKLTTGVFLLTTHDHVFCIKDFVIYDSFKPSGLVRIDKVILVKSESK